MEVHKHPHHVTHKKKWGEYLLEFLMLFLAVFLGFIAENLREHRVEQGHEKEYIESLIKDLQYDTLQYGKTIKRLQNKIEYYDSVLLFLKNPTINNYLSYKLFTKTANEQFYTPTKPTIEQLKASGNFRLIHKKEARDSILQYDSRLSGAYKNQTEYAVEFNKRIVIGMEKIFDFTGLNNLLNNRNGDYSAKIEGVYDLRLVSNNKDLIQEVYNMHISTKGAEIFYMYMMQSTKILAANLISFLKKEYNLK